MDVVQILQGLDSAFSQKDCSIVLQFCLQTRVLDSSFGNTLHYTPSWSYATSTFGIGL